MTRLTVFFIFLAVASFVVYLVERPVLIDSKVEPARLIDSGLAWVDGNQSSVFFVVNASQETRLVVDVLAERVPARVWIWNESDQARFEVFAEKLERSLTRQSIVVGRLSRKDLLQSEPAVLVVVGSAIPAELLQDGFLASLLDKGWAVLYSGFPFSFVRKATGIVQNARWDSLREGLGMDFDVAEAAAVYGISVRRGSLRKVDSWKVFRREPGVLAFWPGLLDASFSDVDAVAISFSDFISHARWSSVVVSFSSNVSTLSTVFSPVFSQTAQQALVFLAQGDAVRREAISWPPNNINIIHPEWVRSNNSVFVSVLSNLSRGDSFELSVTRSGQVVSRRALGVFPSGLSWHSFRLEANLPDGDYVLAVFGSNKTQAYSVLRVFSYRVQVEQVDAASKSLHVRLRAGIRPAAGLSFKWRGREVKTDAQGRVRLKDVVISGGINRGQIELDGQVLSFDYSIQGAFLSSWTDRALFAAALGLFGLAWFWQSKRPGRISLLAAQLPSLRIVRVTPEQLKCVLVETNARLKRGCVPLSLREFRDGVAQFLCGPECFFTDESVFTFLSCASDSRLVYWKDGFVAWRAWYACERDFCVEGFWRRLSDALTSGGWVFKRKGLRVFCCRKGRRMTLRVTPQDGRIFASGSKGLSLDEWCKKNL